MAYIDGGTFTTYCDKCYDRHTYRILWKDGSSTDFDSYDLLKYHWYQNKEMAESVKIIDPKKGGVGF